MLKLVNQEKCICNSKFVFEYLFACLLVNWWCTTKLFIYCLFILCIYCEHCLFVNWLLARK